MSALLFGKLPAHGDFVTRGIGREAADALDRWLSASMRDAQGALGEDFAARYDSAPPWRFQVDLEGPVAGAIAPSVDAAGRRFPILIARRLGGEDAPAAVAEGCEAAIYDALAERRSADAALAGIAIAAGAAPAVRGWWCADAAGAVVARLGEERPPALVRAMASVLEPGA